MNQCYSIICKYTDKMMSIHGYVWQENKLDYLINDIVQKYIQWEGQAVQHNIAKYNFIRILIIR